MIKICKYCKKEVEIEKFQQMGAHVSNCDSNPNKKIKNEKSVKTKSEKNPIAEYVLICKKCGGTYTLKLKLFNFKNGIYTKHCSRNCANGHSKNEKRNKIKCFNCNSFLSGNETKFCSIKCQTEHRWKIRKEKIENGVSSNYPIPFKKYLKEIRGHECEICHTKMWNEQPVPLVLDHISGNSDDWSLKNLRLICPNCDAQTPTFSGRNRGNGRIKRKQKRHEEKLKYLQTPL